MPKELAVFKYAPTRTLPIRSGPVQCVRNCTNCVLNQDLEEDPDGENVIAIKSYDDLIRRKSPWLTRYQTAQFHPGQIDVLKRTLKLVKPTLVIYIVAVTRLKDTAYLEHVLEHVRLPKARVQTGNLDLALLDSETGTNTVIVPTKIISCATNVFSERGVLDADGLRRFLEPLVDRMDSFEDNSRVAIVPVAVCKEHDRTEPFGIGSVCVQIMQPYPVGEYLNNVRADDKTSHLVHHLYRDLSVDSICLPSNLVALLLVYLDRPCGVNHEDLVDYMRWFRKNAMDLDLHMAFTGEENQVVNFALLNLRDYVFYDTAEQVYRPKDTHALAQYASSVVPNLAYYGMISRAILLLYNEENDPIARFTAEFPIKVMKDDLIEMVQEMAKEMDTLIPCRRPCIDIGTSVMNAFNSMMTFGRYFRIQEPRARPARVAWLGDYDSDEDYFLSKRDDPAFKSWVILTQRPYRLDRLNLFMHVTEVYFDWIAYQQSESEDSKLDSPEVPEEPEETIADSSFMESGDL